MELQDRLDVDNGGNMKLTKKELKMIRGGSKISASLFSALLKGVESIMDFGRYFGSSLRRMFGNGICPFN